MLLGIFSGVLSHQPLDKFAAKIKSHGYQAIELAGRPGDGHVVPDKVLSGQGSEIRRICDENELEITAISSHLNHLHPDPAKREELNGHFFKILDCAQQLGVRVVNTFSGAPEGNFIKGSQVIWDDFRETFLPIIDKAKSYGIKIGIEVHWGSMAYNIPTMDKMFEEIPDKTLGLNYDPSHFMWQLQDYLIPLRKFKDRVYHSHAKDIKIYPDILREYGVNDRRYYTQTIPGWGDADWATIARILMLDTECEVLSFEHEDPLFLPDDGIKKAAEFLRQFTIQF